MVKRLWCFDRITNIDALALQHQPPTPQRFDNRRPARITEAVVLTKEGNFLATKVGNKVAYQCLCLFAVTCARVENQALHWLAQDCCTGNRSDQDDIGLVDHRKNGPAGGGSEKIKQRKHLILVD